MLKVIFFINIIVVPYIAGAQENNSIKYYFPDTVEAIINHFMETKNLLSKNEKTYLHLEKDSSAFKLFIISGEVNKKICWWIKSTNRVAVVNKQLIPLIFDYDEIFSTDAIEVVGSFGNRNGEIKKGVMIYHDPVIYFDHHGHVTKTIGLK